MLSELHVWVDNVARSAPEQMAVDQALLHAAQRPVIRFYRWLAPALTFGYAQRYADVRACAGELPAIRRWTGGGMVFHGEDLTIALAVPASHDLCLLQTGVIYRQIHEAFLGAVVPAHPGARLARPGDCRPGAACFQSPALNDILQGGKKLCGGAMRRGKLGILYQGSLHGNIPAWPLGRALCESAAPFNPDGELLELSARLDQQQYATESWNQMR